MLNSLILDIAIIVGGLLFLSKAATTAIKRVLALTRHWGFSEFIISFLFIGVVAILPELLIGVVSALSGASSFGAGIVIGANIADLTLIVGLVALLTKGIKLYDYTFSNIKKLVLFVPLPLILFLDGVLSRTDGVVLILAFAIYLVMMIKRHTKNPATRIVLRRVIIFKELLILLIAVGVMIFSAHIITVSAKNINVALAMPIFFIGIVVALGTCLPELMVSLKSNKQRHGELGLGDILGNVFADCLLTLGIIAVISPIRPDYPLLVISGAFLMIFSMLILMVISRSENRISRDEGLLLIILYFFFLAVQFGLEQVIAG